MFFRFLSRDRFLRFYILRNFGLHYCGRFIFHDYLALLLWLRCFDLLESKIAWLLFFFLCVNRFPLLGDWVLLWRFLFVLLSPLRKGGHFIMLLLSWLDILRNLGLHQSCRLIFHDHFALFFWLYHLKFIPKLILSDLSLSILCLNLFPLLKRIFSHPFLFLLSPLTKVADYLVTFILFAPFFLFLLGLIFFLLISL